MTGSDFATYVGYTFKRTDKSTEIYVAVTDAVSEMSNRFGFTERETEMTTTDTIAVLGDFKLTLESNMGYLVADIVVVDGDSSRQLDIVSKDEFDRLYPNPSSSTATRAKPRHACIFASQIYLGPVPDSTSYTYRVSFSQDLSAAISSGTANVPFSGFASRECLKYFTLEKLYGILENDTLEAKYKARADLKFRELAQREEKLRRRSRIVQYRGI